MSDIEYLDEHTIRITWEEKPTLWDRAKAALGIRSNAKQSRRSRTERQRVAKEPGRKATPKPPAP